MRPILAKRSAEISELCRRFHVKRLDVFGSAARESDFTHESDVDLLVEYDPAHSPPRFGDFLALRDALADMLGRKVDLVAANVVRNPYIRASIERSRQPLYGA